MLTRRVILHHRTRVAHRKRMAMSKANAGDALRLQDWHAIFALQPFFNQGTLVNNIIHLEVARWLRDGEEETAEEGRKCKKTE